MWFDYVLFEISLHSLVSTININEKWLFEDETEDVYVYEHTLPA